tara:strand:+ start:2141 stop:3013 length:873 start_codon:yes stop_codon:yes gene_type:complete
MAESQEFELELPEVEVDPREADVIQEPQQDQDFSEPEQEAAQTQESELDDYSDGVKKRIDKLTYRMREAERQREEAVKLAKQMAEQNAALQTKLKSSDSTLVNEYNTRVTSQKEQARKALKEAQELGDAEAIALATEAVAKTSLEEQNVQRLMSRQKQEAESQPQVENPVEQQLQPAPLDSRTEEWAEKNSWFGQDDGMTYAAMGIHQKLLKEGVAPSTKHYFERVDAEMRELFPTKFADETKNVQSSVAGTSRGAAPAKKGTRSVKLTPSQMAIAKRIGVPYEEYAKYV